MCKICGLAIESTDKQLSIFTRDDAGKQIPGTKSPVHTKCYIDREVAAYRQRVADGIVKSEVTDAAE
jgi:hypothetical protein